jgi:hypothetical protein
VDQPVRTRAAFGIEGERVMKRATIAERHGV